MSSPTPVDASPDSSERIQDFLSRHGGPAPRPGNAGDIVAGLSGWTEVYAADGYTLRCDWSRMGGPLELQFSEQRPKTGPGTPA